MRIGEMGGVEQVFGHRWVSTPSLRNTEHQVALVVRGLVAEQCIQKAPKSGL